MPPRNVSGVASHFNGHKSTRNKDYETTENAEGPAALLHAAAHRIYPFISEGTTLSAAVPKHFFEET